MGERDKHKRKKDIRPIAHRKDVLDFRHGGCTITMHIAIYRHRTPHYLWIVIQFPVLMRSILLIETMHALWFYLPHVPFLTLLHRRTFFILSPLMGLETLSSMLKWLTLKNEAISYCCLDIHLLSSSFIEVIKI